MGSLNLDLLRKKNKGHQRRSQRVFGTGGGLLPSAKTGRTIRMKVFCLLTWRQGLVLGENGLLSVGHPTVLVSLH